MKLGQTGIGSNIVQNHSSSTYEVLSDHYLPQFTWKVYQKCNYVMLESVRTLLRITRLAHRKSYLLIYLPNSDATLTKGEIMTSWSRFKHCSESLVLSIGSHIWSLFTTIHIQSLPKVKLGEVEVGSNIAQNHSS